MPGKLRNDAIFKLKIKIPARLGRVFKRRVFLFLSDKISLAQISAVRKAQFFDLMKLHYYQVISRNFLI